MINREIAVAAKANLLALLVAAGWPKAIGPNDKRKAAHNRLALDGSTVDTFSTPGAGFFADAAIKAVTTGKTRDAALIAMVETRENPSVPRFWLARYTRCWNFRVPLVRTDPHPRQNSGLSRRARPTRDADPRAHHPRTDPIFRPSISVRRPEKRLCCVYIDRMTRRHPLTATVQVSEFVEFFLADGRI